MSFYLEGGYLDFRAVRDLPVPFIIVVGGRGTGKTYGALEACIEDEQFFAFMRRSQTQLDLISKPQFSPVRRVCRDHGWQIIPAPIAKGISGYYYYEVEDGRNKIQGSAIGINVALSTVANVRGFDASDLDIMIFDEAIPERGEKPLPGEWDKLANCYETINRNRELEGLPALKLVCLANANKQTAPILEGLRLVGTLDKMIQRGQELYMDKARGLALVLLQDSPISAAKQDTALYRLTSGTDYAEMAIGNRFAYEDRARCGTLPLRELRPMAAVGGVTIYRHKSQRLWYVTRHKSGSPQAYGTGEMELAKFRRDLRWIYDEILSDRVIFEDYAVQAELFKYINM